MTPVLLGFSQEVYLELVDNTQNRRCGNATPLSISSFWYKWERAQVMQWLFFEQYSHEPYIATSRYWISLLGKAAEYQDLIQQKREPGYAALKVMDQHLSTNNFFVANRYTIADIALFAYTHVAEEGGFELGGFPKILAWLDRIEAQPRYIKITA